jgi:hypothetical protein
VNGSRFPCKFLTRSNLLHVTDERFPQSDGGGDVAEGRTVDSKHVKGALRAPPEAMQNEGQVEARDAAVGTGLTLVLAFDSKGGSAF